MTKGTARIAEVCRRAVTPGAEGYISTEIEAVQRTAVENVKKKIIAGKQLRSVLDEWKAAREEHKKWRLQQ